MPITMDEFDLIDGTTGICASYWPSEDEDENDQDIAAAKEALADPRRIPYEEIRRRNGLQ